MGVAMFVNSAMCCSVAGDTKRLNCVQVFHRSKFHILIFEDCATSQTWGYENREKEQWRRGECSQFQQTRLFNTVAYCSATYMKSHVATIRVNIFVHSLYFYFYFPFPFFLFSFFPFFLSSFFFFN